MRPGAVPSRLCGDPRSQRFWVRGHTGDRCSPWTLLGSCKTAEGDAAVNPSAFSGDNLISRQIKDHDPPPMRPEAQSIRNRFGQAALLEQRGKETAEGIR